MSAERWLRIAAAAALLLLVVAAGALAAQWRTSQEAARLRAQLTQMQRQPGAAEPDARPGPMEPSPVALTRVRLVPEEQPAAPQNAGAGETTRAGQAAAATPQEPAPVVTGPFSVQATVSNRSDRTVKQPVYAFLIISDPKNPGRAPELQRQEAVIESLAPGDTTTVVLKGFRAQDPGLRHEVVVTTPALDPARPGGTVAKIVPQVKAAARPAPQPPAARTPPPAPQPAPPAVQPPATQPPAAQAPSPQPPAAQPPAGAAPGAENQEVPSQEQE
ncbi:MAG: hypothetical protein AB1609_18330 [Bacillota bacterium]